MRTRRATARRWNFRSALGRARVGAPRPSRLEDGSSQAWYAVTPLELRTYAHSRVTLVYALVGIAWIILSDRALEWLGFSGEDLGRLQTYKGSLFVAITTALLYVLVNRTTRVIARAASALREQHRALSTLIANLPGGVYRRRAGAEDAFEYASPGASALFAEADGEHSFLDLVHPDDRADVRARVDDALRNGRAFEVTYRVRARDGCMHWVWDHGRPIDGHPDPMLEGYVCDVTERAVLAERLQRGQRLESLGRMASGIAHDFNNVVFAVTGGCELLLLEPLSPRSRELVAQIAQAGDRAHALIGRLLAFARQQPVKPSEVTLSGVVKSSEPILRRLLGKRATLSLSLAPELDKVRADATQLEQVLLNLVTNAGQAVGDGGHVTIETGHRELTEAETLEAGIPCGSYEMLAVSDDGCGIEPAVLPHVFDPFFSTKGDAGTGLGLATVYSIVRQNGGGILVSTQPGAGTTFRVLLPRVVEQRSPSLVA